MASHPCGQVQWNLFQAAYCINFSGGGIMMTFDRIFARFLLEICRYTYAAGFDDQVNAADKQDAFNWIKQTSGLVTPDPQILRGSDTAIACVASYPERNIISYMGTKTQFDTYENAIASIQDWSRNFEALLVPFKLSSAQLGGDQPLADDNLGGLVHDGFLKQLTEVQDQVIATLMQNGGKGRPVFVTGHSQGGAVAALATRALLAGGFPVVSTYTFAAPRPGDMTFIKSIPETLPIHRIEFGDDIVPHVPPILLTEERQGIVELLKGLPGLPDEVGSILDFLQVSNNDTGFASLGRLCYGSNKTQSLRVDLSAEQEESLFYDRLWSLARHPDHWIEHHHLAGTSEDVQSGKKRNYTALVSDFQIVS
jgi:triacylglycerol lipase